MKFLKNQILVLGLIPFKQKIKKIIKQTVIRKDPFNPKNFNFLNFSNFWNDSNLNLCYVIQNEPKIRLSIMLDDSMILKSKKEGSNLRFIFMNYILCLIRSIIPNIDI